MTAPLVGIVVVNYNGGDLTIRCIESILALDWPPERRHVVLVDNASSDGVAAEVSIKWPDVEVVVSDVNAGFAGGCNIGIRRLANADYIGLVNNDATVEPRWLDPLVEALERDPRAGAAASKILFATPFAEVQLKAPTFTPGRGDRRALGVRLAGARVGGHDASRDLQAVDGFWGLEFGPDGAYQWTSGSALFRVPWTDGHRSAQLLLAAEREKEVVLLSGNQEVQLLVGDEPSWHEIPIDGPPVDVVQNAGSVLVADGYGADRGYLEVDRGQYDQADDVFAWCGAGVLLSRRYLDSVGLFDERLFLYYEDFDLSWRGRTAGWRYRYEPRSIVRHVHASTSVEGSERFHYFVERNRLLVLTKNAPARVVIRAVIRYLLITASYARRDVVSPLLRARRPSGVAVRRRLAAFGAYLRHLPGALESRGRQRVTLKRRRTPVA